MEVYKKWLRENGYKFDVLPFGIGFKHQGANLIIPDNEEDELFLQIIMPGIYSANNASERERAYKVCNELTREVKCLKAFLADENLVWLSTEIFIDNTPELDDFMDRLLDILHQGRNRFIAKI
jgi:hypothetical protein